MNPLRPGWLLAAGWLAFLAPARAGVSYIVRLAVVDGVEEATFRGDRLAVLDGDVGDTLLVGVDKDLRVRALADGLGIPGLRTHPRSVFLRAEGPILVLGRRLTGGVEVRRMSRGLLVVNHLPLDRYLQGLLGAEMSPSWPLEALRAQAVASRTYAVRRCLDREGEPYDLASTTLDQVYTGIGKEAASTRKAVSTTRGEVLVYDGIPAEALFHSCCGGRTRAAGQVFGNPVPYLVAVDDPDCSACPKYRWKVVKPRAWLQGRIKGFFGTRRPLESVPNHHLRRAAGVAVLFSNDFSMSQQGDDLLIQGRGSGHGVGMCQWGARGKAERGIGYRGILKRYYPGCTLRKMY